MKTKIRLRATTEQIKIVSEFENMARIMNAAFGGGKKPSGPATPAARASAAGEGQRNVFAPQTMADAKWMLKRVLGGAK